MKTWLDNVTGRVTMYRLVLYVLIAITVVGIVVAAFGLLSYGWLDLLTSAIVAVVATAATSWLFAKPFGVTAHLDSALITGLIIFVVLPPGIGNLGVIALAGAIASASKYVLAWRGRHLVNPAAVGAFVVTATGLTFNGWWVATGPLLPFVAVGALLVLYRTRRLGLGTFFVVLAGAIEVTRFLLSGVPIGSALSTAFVSLPIVFFAGFMLSEPLTLPPRRWQTFVVAAIVAVLFAVPFSLGPIYSSPQLALIIGNIVAFGFGQRRGVLLQFTGKRQLSATTWEFAFVPQRAVRFTAGQYMELTLPHARSDSRGSRRVFSISSAPTTNGTLTFAMTVDPIRPSSFKRALLSLEPGAHVHGTSVGGDFTLPADQSVPTLLVAGGIGITPFSSQLAEAAAAGHERDVVVVYAVRDAGELAYADVLERSGATVVLIAPEAPELLPQNWSYGGNGRISRELLEASVPDIAARRAFVSGPPGLVNDVRRMLSSLGAKRVTSDYFSGY